MKGVVLFSGKSYTIMVLHYFHNIQLCLAYEYTKHKQLKTTTDMHIEQIYLIKMILPIHKIS